MSTHIGLYFPYFHFPNDEWVKLAALYWDKMARIIPDGYAPRRDTDMIKALSKEELFIINETPGGVQELVKTEFLKLVTDHKKELIRLYRISERSDWPDHYYTVQYAPTGANPKLSYIYLTKIEKELTDVLCSLKLGTLRSDTGADYQWVGMHPKLANVYMAALAETMAKTRGIHPVAYDTDNYFAVAGFTFERLAQVLLEDAKITSSGPTTQEAESLLATIAIKTIMPKDIGRVSIDKILRIREKRSGELGRFQTFVQDTVSNLPELESVKVNEFVYYHLEAEYKKQIKPQLEDLEEVMKLNGIETVSGILNLEVKMPSLLAGLSALTGVTILNPLLGATATVALGLLKIIADKRKAYKDALDKSDVAYLLHLQEGLTPETSLKGLTSRARQLTFGI